MIKKELQLELNRTKLILDYARQEIEDKDKEIERLNTELEMYKNLEQWLKEQELKYKNAGALDGYGIFNFVNYHIKCMHDKKIKGE